MKSFVMKNVKYVIIVSLISCISLLSPYIMVSAAEDFTPIVPTKISTFNVFTESLMDNPDSMQGGKITYNKGTCTNTYFNFNMPEKGLVKLRFSISDYGDDSNFLDASCTVYMDKAMTSAASKTISLDNDYKDNILELNKGTYYVECVSNVPSSFEIITNEDYLSNVVGLAIAYIPIKTTAIDFSIKQSKTETTTDNITVTVIPEDPGSEIYMLPGIQKKYDLKSEFCWSDKTKLSGDTFVVTENGDYTVRIINSIREYSQKVITINNIDKSTPATPTITTYKTNSTKLSGKADAGTKVYVYVGKKSYTGIARDNGYYYISVSKLVKGTEIKILSEDYAGNKSDWCIVKVK